VKSLADRDEHWPYTEAEAAAIRGYFCPPSANSAAGRAAERALNIAVNAARNFVDLFEPDRKKPNVRDQVQRLGDAVMELRRAICGLSNDAEKHIKRRRRHPLAEISAPWSPADGNGNVPVETGELHALLHRFAYENGPGFKDLPPQTSAGPVEQKLEKSLVSEFKRSFLAGHRLAEGRHGPIKRLPTGRPAFIALCRDPLVKMGLLKNLDTKSLQDK
jgi:hypothetical protein